MFNRLVSGRQLRIKRRRTVLLQRDKMCCTCGEDLLAGQFAIKIVYWSGGLNFYHGQCQPPHHL